MKKKPRFEIRYSFLCLCNRKVIGNWDGETMIEIPGNCFPNAFNLCPQRVAVLDRALLTETNDLRENKDQSWTHTWIRCHSSRRKAPCAFCRARKSWQWSLLKLTVQGHVRSYRRSIGRFQFNVATWMIRCTLTQDSKKMFLLDDDRSGLQGFKIQHTSEISKSKRVKMKI